MHLPEIRLALFSTVDILCVASCLPQIIRVATD